MVDKLTVDAAKELISFISKTNYQLAPHDNGPFESQNEALTFIQSDLYDPELPLNICFRVKNKEWGDGAEVFFSENSGWSVEDRGMGGKSGTGDTIESAIIDFRNQHNLNDDFSPEELVITK